MLFSVAPYKSAAETADDLLQGNGSFEKDRTGWSYYKKDGKTYHEWMKEDSGNHYLKITNSNDAADPWVGRSVKGIVSGAVYQVKARMKSEWLTKNFGFKLEYYGASSWIMEEEERFGGTNKVWMENVFTFVAPQNCTSVYFYPRLFGTGEVCFDDIVITRMEDEIPVFFMEPETAFFYTENPYGTVRIRKNQGVYTYAGDEKFVLEIRDGNAVLSSYEKGADSAEITFPTKALKTVGKEYTLYVSLRKSNGTEIYGVGDTVYRYPRPSLIDENGIFHDKNGKVVHPSIGYHCGTANYGRLSELGVNVVQVTPQGDVSAAKKALNKAAEEGIYVLLELYVGMLPAGHSDNSDSTEEMVRETMSHKALFGYMIMDEPMVNAYRVGGSENMYALLKKSYKIIRDIDSMHPVYAVECYENAFSMTAACTDVFAIDMYPSTKEAMPTRTYLTTKKAVETVNGKKPVYHILQAYNLSGNYEPSAADMRHMAYQAFFGGASGIGYYPICDDDSILWENDLYNGVACFAKEEQAGLFGAFKGENCEVIDCKEDENGVSGIVYRKNGAVYVAAINRTEEEKSFSRNTGGSGIQHIGEALPYTFINGVLQTEIPPHGIFSCRVTGAPTIHATKEGTVLYKYLPGEVQLSAFSIPNNSYAFFVLYRDENEIVDIFMAGETAVLPEGNYSLKGFCWQSALCPLTETYVIK